MTNQAQSPQAADSAMGKASSSEEHAGKLTYGEYLKIPQLLNLQQRRVGDQSHDEMLFIILHQTYELWFRQVLHELDAALQHIRCDDLPEANRLIERVLVIGGLLVDQWDVLGTMRPRDYGHFRNALRPASGFQSAQFRELEIIMAVNNPRTLQFFKEGSDERNKIEARRQQKNLKDHLLDAFQKHGFSVRNDDGSNKSDSDIAHAIVPIYQEPEKHRDLYQLCESIVQLEQWLLSWRYRHVQAVEKIIGTKSGTGGSTGVEYLRKTLDQEAFRFLIEVRACLDEDVLFGSYRPPTCG